MGPQTEVIAGARFFGRRQFGLRLLIHKYPLAIQGFVIVQQAIGTAWFWGSTIIDQLRAEGNGENTATWLGGGEVFLMTAAYLQYKVMRKEPRRKNIALFVVQCLSAFGGGVALGIFVYRRWYWSYTDTLCFVAVMGAMVGSAAMYMRRNTRRPHRYLHWSRVYVRTYTWPFTRDRRRRRAHVLFVRLAVLRRFFRQGTAVLVMAIAFRGVPRLFQSASLMINNPMSFMTVLSGIYIALSRLLAVGLVRHQSGTKEAGQAWYVELIGNFGSQIVLALGWAVSQLLL